MTTKHFTFRNVLHAFLLLIAVHVPASAQEFSPDVKKILELQDRRTFGDNDELGKYLLSTDPELRRRALIAVGNIGDSSGISKFNFLLAGPFKDYPVEDDFRAAAFAVSQIPCEESRNFARFILDENNSFGNNAIKYFIVALGKTGDADDLERISKYAYSGDTGITRAVAKSIAGFGIRRIRSASAVDALKQLANNSDDKLTLALVAFAFWRTGDKQLLENAKREIYSLAESEDAQTRMWGFNALGRLADKGLLMYTLESFLSEDDNRVKVNMLNTLGAYVPDSLKDMRKQLNTIFLTAVQDKDLNVSLNAVNVMGRFFSALASPEGIDWKNDAAAILKKLLNAEPPVPEQLAGAAAIALAQIIKDRSEEDLFGLLRKTDNYKVKKDVLTAFGEFENGSVLKKLRDTLIAEVNTYNRIHPNTEGKLVPTKDLGNLYAGFVQAVCDLDNKLEGDDRITSRLILLEFAGSKDPLITAIALDGLQDSIYLSDRNEIASVFRFDFGELAYPDDLLVQLIFIDAIKNLGVKGSEDMLEPLLSSENFELANSAADAIEALSGKRPEFNAQKKYDFDWDYIEGMSGKTAILKTSKGDIKLELFSNEAPFTVQNFLKLAQNDYFDSTIFHRVVPNFVIQGGDPSGTGYGGPENSIRSEFNDIGYDAGMLGMASSGKDTEGSQFFITHSATPHLDGRYTIFGRVSDGMNIVNDISVGDLLFDVVIR